MQRSLTTAGVGLLLVLGLAACGNGATTSASAPGASGSAEPAPSSAEGCSVGTGAGDVEVAATGFAFDPTTVSATVGQTIAWVNGDAAPHTVTLDDGSCASEQFTQGESVSLTFGTAGTFAYHCEVHPSMTGTVEVTG